MHRLQGCNKIYTRIGSNKGKTPEHNQAKHKKHPHSLEWHNAVCRGQYLRNIQLLRFVAANAGDSMVSVLYMYRSYVEFVTCPDARMWITTIVIY